MQRENWEFETHRWLRTSWSEARRQAPRNGASSLNAARVLGIRDAQARTPSGARRRVSYPVSDSMSCIRRANEHGTEKHPLLAIPALSRPQPRRALPPWPASPPMGPPILPPFSKMNECLPPLRAPPSYHREAIWSLLVHKLIRHGLEPAVVANLEASGWARINTISGASRDELGKTMLDAAGALGRPVPSLPGRPLVEWLSTAPEQTRRPNLTALHGSGGFPLHTDTAHWPVPARYLFLSCFEPGEAGRATLVWRFDETVLTGSQLDTLRGEPVLFVTGRNSFYSTVLSPSRPFVRIDLGCMRAVTRGGR